jgi:hypothetical protein
MIGPRTGPSPLERLTAIAVALGLHLALLTFWPWRAPGVFRPPPPASASISVGFYRMPRVAIATAPQLVSGRAPATVHVSRHGSIPVELHVAEREIIDEGNGVTMTIEGMPPPGAPPPPPKVEQWLEMDVWVDPITPPRPGDFCVPGQPRMPDFAVDHDLTGKVTATYLVDSDGAVADVMLVPGAPSILAHAVTDWLHGCLFVPARQGGKRTAARVKQSFLFEIR